MIAWFHSLPAPLAKLLPPSGYTAQHNEVALMRQVVLRLDHLSLFL